MQVSLEIRPVHVQCTLGRPVWRCCGTLTLMQLCTCFQVCVVAFDALIPVTLPPETLKTLESSLLLARITPINM